MEKAIKRLITRVKSVLAPDVGLAELDDTAALAFIDFAVMSTLEVMEQEQREVRDSIPKT